MITMEKITVTHVNSLPLIFPLYAMVFLYFTINIVITIGLKKPKLKNRMVFL